MGPPLRRHDLAGLSLRAILAVAVILLIAAGPAVSQQNGLADLTELSLEELLNVEVTSVSKKAEKRTEVAAAAFVLTNDDI